MAKTPTTTKPTAAQLRAENKRLLAENAALKKQQASSSRPTRHRPWRSFAIILCTVVAGAVLVAGNLLFWAGNTVVDNGRFASTTSPLIKQPEIQQGLALYATNKIYENVDVQQTIQDVLPPRADFLAPSLSSQVKNLTQTSFEKLLANQRFQDAWTDTLTNAHSRIINYVKNYQGDGTITLNDFYNRLSSNLQDTKLSFLANKTLPSNVGNITIIEAGWLPTAHNIVVNIGLYQALSTLLVIILSVLAVWLAKNRRKMVIILGTVYSVLMAITLVSIRLSQNLIPKNFDSQYQAAVSAAVKTITNSLLIQTRTILLLGLLVILIAWITGSSRVAAVSRVRINLLLEGKLHTAIFAHENSLTRWIGGHKRVLQWTAIAIIAAIMLLVSLSPALVLWYALFMLVIVLIIEMLAAPQNAQA